MPLQNRLRCEGGAWIDCTPAGKIARQDLEREQRGRNLREAFVGFLGASGRRSFFEKLAKLTMGFDERTKSRLPQDIRQATIAVQVVITFNQASALIAQFLRKKVEVGTVIAVRKHIAACTCCLFHRFVPRPAMNFAQRRSIASPPIYLRWMAERFLIAKK